MIKILLICTGNTCRSPMAEGFFRGLLSAESINAEVASAGLSTMEGALATPQAISVMRDRCIDISMHRARQVTAAQVGRADLVLTMTLAHKERLLRMMPEAKGKVFTLKEFAWGDTTDLDIEDPFGKSVDFYHESSKEIEEALKQIITKLKEEGGWREKRN